MQRVELRHLTLDLWFAMWDGLAELCQTTQYSKRPSYLWYRFREHQNDRRHFHNLVHIDECVGHWVAIQDKFRDSKWLSLYTLVMHDYVYDSARTNNESESAKAAEQYWDLVGLPSRSTWLQWVQLGIQFTDHKRFTTYPDYQRICDIDLMSLSVDWPQFKRNSVLIRREYSQYSTEDYWIGRRNFFVEFANRPKIYQSAEFAQFEQVVRGNMQRMVELINTKYPPP